MLTFWCSVREGSWYIEGHEPVFHGLPGDVPVPGDYDGDGDDDVTVFRPSVGGWFVADGDAERAVWRPGAGAWHVEGQPTAYLGIAGDVPLPLAAAIHEIFFSER